jgi:hypothetical protein
MNINTNIKTERLIFMNSTRLSYLYSGNPKDLEFEPYYDGDPEYYLAMEFYEDEAKRRREMPFVDKNGFMIKDGVLFGYEGYSRHIVIPEGVTEISELAFLDKNISSVTIPNTVTKIGIGAFSGCTFLKSINIPDSVLEIGECAFSRCTLLKDIIISSNSLSINKGAFYDCRFLENLSFPENANSIINISEEAFKRCPFLTNIKFPDIAMGVHERAFDKGVYESKDFYWEDDVFYLKSNIVKINKDSPIFSGDYKIKEGIKAISDQVFKECYNLTNVNIPSSVRVIGCNVFRDCKLLESISIPEGITSIKKGTFQGCSSLKKAVIPNSITNIEKWAFMNCVSLSNATIPKGVTNIGDDAFSGTSFDITIPDGTTRINNGVFFASNAKYVTIPKNITHIGDDAFYRSQLLTNVTMENGVTYIGKGAFAECHNLTSVTIPPSLTKIDNFAFSHCEKLNNIYITDIKAWCNIKYTSESSSPLYYAKNLYLNGKLIEDITIPEGTTKIGCYSFKNCESLVSVTIPDSVTSIAHEAFCCCKSLTNITLPNTLTNIGTNAFCQTAYFNNDSNWENNSLYIDNYLIKVKPSISGDYTIKEGTRLIADSAFENCASLTNITIPESVEYIGWKVFTGCKSLESITIEGNPKLNKEMFFTDFSSPPKSLKEIIVRNEKMKQYLLETVRIPEGCEIKVVEPSLEEKQKGANKIESLNDTTKGIIESLASDEFLGEALIENDKFPDGVIFETNQPEQVVNNTKNNPEIG